MIPNTEPERATSGPKSRAGKPEAPAASRRVLGLAFLFYYFSRKVLMNVLLPNSSHISINRVADSVSVLFPHPFTDALTDETQWRPWQMKHNGDGLPRYPAGFSQAL